MKIAASLSFSMLVTASLGVAILTVTAQTASPAQAPAGSTPPPPPRTFPAPTNLMVLPTELSGEQVRDIMERWEKALGARCDTCHTADPKNIAPNGKPRLNFADDSKPEKRTARIMYRMTEEINTNYVAKVPNSGMGVGCGTCHRGHLAPEPFVPAEKDERHTTPEQPGHMPRIR